MPLEVDMPAPARTTMFFLFRRRSTTDRKPSENDGDEAILVVPAVVQYGVEYSGKGPEDIDKLLVVVLVHCWCRCCWWFWRCFSDGDAAFAFLVAFDFASVFFVLLLVG
jgi:hypothetical protein